MQGQHPCNESSFKIKFVHPLSSVSENGSENFDGFLGVIGEKIRLKGWERYRGGLDVKGNYCGRVFLSLPEAWWRTN